jgi:hypothetical protein
VAKELVGIAGDQGGGTGAFFPGRRTACFFVIGMGKGKKVGKSRGKVVGCPMP